MDKRTRNIVFYSLCVVFAVVGTLVVLYAQGWRFDLETFGFKKVGGIYLRSFPKDADIFINDKYVDKNPGLLDSGRFISDLFPKTYKLSLVKDGYIDWTEHIQVNPALVTELKYAVLIPKTSESAYKGALKSFSADNNQLIINSGNSLSIDGEKIRGENVIFQNGDSKIALAENAATRTYFVNYFNGDTPTSTILNAKFSAYGISPASIKEIIRDPNSSSGAIFGTSSKVFYMDIQTGDISTLALSSQTITEIAASPSWIAWVNFDPKSGKSKISFYNRSSNSVQNEAAIPGTAAKISFIKEDIVGILQTDGGFYTASPNSLPAQAGKPQKMADNVRDFSSSNDGTRVSLLEPQTVEIFSLGSESGYWRFRLPDAEKIERTEWYSDGNHLFVIYPGEIKFLDLNDKDIENFMTAASGNNFEYDLESNTLYFINDGILRKMVFPQ
ncbi:MAG TPA: hypothetical protein VMV71_04085 [Candidatus Paceibacterota bacterium]|nr:hypothetical protein [Candidatus Paceibacterota bacterium]